jgi:hypothetical protein
MADKKNQALGRLTKKLSALRATLRKDERDLLDELILGAAAEVAAHSMTTAAATKAMKTPKTVEVAAHSMTTAAATKAMKTPKTVEVAAHSMAGAASKSARVSRPSARRINELIEFDEQAKVYRVKII